MQRIGLAVAAATIALAVAACWLPILDASLFWDDRGTLLATPWLQGPWSEFWDEALRPQLGHWQPLSWLSLRLDVPLWGGLLDGAMGAERAHRAVTPHLLGNLVLHTAAALALFALASRTLATATATATSPLWARAMAAGWATLAWALHPTRVESVAWVTERRDVLATLLVLLGLRSWLGARTAGRRPYVAVALFAASALAKAWIIALPGALFGLEIALFAAASDRASLWSAARRSAAWLVLALPVAIVAALAQHAAGATAAAAGLTPLERGVTALAALPRYLGLTLWPATLSPLHPIVPGAALAWPSLLAATLTLLAGALLWRQGRRWPSLLGACVGAVAWLAPVLGLLQSGVQAVAERYLILAQVPLALGAATGICLLLATGVTPLPAGRWLPGPWTLPTLVVASAVLAPLLVRLLLWQGVWIAGEEALWSAAIAAEPASPHALANRASMRLQRGAVDEAAADLDAAIALQPSFANAWTLRAEVLRARASAAAAVGDGGGVDRALALALQALDRALTLEASDRGARCNRAALRAERGDGAGATTDFADALRDGDDAGCRLNRAVFAARSGDREAAARDVAAALRLLPATHPERPRALGMARALGMRHPAGD